ncbi:MAG: excinuclease ABC subunit UvrC [Rhodospirillaceae bacterium]|nr:excinuclease ABC subunit UvrC [Rhodospirillaceae bacterium]
MEINRDQIIETLVDQSNILNLQGTELIRAYLTSLPTSPGVYRMINGDDQVLYIGKAKNLRKRVANYVNPNRLSNRIQRMVSMTTKMEFVLTHTEAEALLLEANLIKKLTPRFNILLRDDKSFPSVLITDDHEFPQVMKYRGSRSRKGKYFGPFASAGAVNQSLMVLQKIFLLRSCSDSIFASRTRPCLLYQIKRCSAPCVNIINKGEYQKLVTQAQEFLEGKSKKIQKQLALDMQNASEQLEFEKAAIFRDRINAMTSLQAKQDFQVSGVAEADIFTLYQAAGQTCVQVFFLRAGSNFGNRAYYPSHPSDANTGEILEAFIGQFYTNKEPPRLILLSESVPEQTLLVNALSNKKGKKVRIEIPDRGEKKKIIFFGLRNTKMALGRKIAENSSQKKLLKDLAIAFNIETDIKRIEVYDNSHISGTNAVGAMIVAGPDGFNKKAYRKFNIKFTSRTAGSALIKDGDDYSMMREVLIRRFSRALSEDPNRNLGHWPDLVLIDGGPGHLSLTTEIFDNLGIIDVNIVAIAKGPNRNAGREKFYLPNTVPFNLDDRDPVLYFLQRLRDEAHRFAIGSHRALRSKKITSSPIDKIKGIGSKRKKALLYNFGSSKGVSEAGLADLECVDGINKEIAKRIYDWFHPED